jgi:hypothetical protein
MVAKTIWRKAENYGVTTSNPLMKIKTAPIQVTTKKFLTWDEANSLQWGRYNNQIRFLALYGLRWSRPPSRIKEIRREKIIYIAKK